MLHSEPATSLQDWELKTLVEDIERLGQPLQDIFLPELSLCNPSFYGTSRNAKFKRIRKLVANKLVDFKRRSNSSYYHFVKNLGVTPSKITTELAKTSTEAQVPMDNKSQTEEEAEELAEALQGFGFKDEPAPAKPATRSASKQQRPFLPPMRSFTPPRSVRRTAFMPSKTPPRVVSVKQSSNLSVSNSASDAHEESRPGSYTNPDLLFVLPGYSGRYINGFGIYEEFEMIKGKQKYAGYFFMKKVDPMDVLLYSAKIATDDYLANLISNGILDQDYDGCCCVLFRGPNVESGDRVGTKSIIPIMFPSETSKNVVKHAHANIPIGVEVDDSPGPSWYYTLAVFPSEVSFDNRVFSDHDHNILRFESMPEKVAVAAIANDEVLVFHAMWRIAIKGTGELLDQDELEDLADRVRKRRAEFMSNPAP